MTERTEAAADEIESQRETIRSLHTALDDLTRAGLEMEQAKNEEIAVLRADLARARRNAAHFEQLFENVEKARAWFSRELDAARTAVGEAWFTGGVTLAEAIERKCRALESDAAKAAAEVKRLQGPSEEPKSEIKRYDTTTVYIGCGEYVGDVEETEDGDYVLFDDHRAIVERLQKDAALGAAVREAAAELDLGPCRWEDADSDDECSVSWAERDVLRAIGRVLAEEGGFDD